MFLAFRRVSFILIQDFIFMGIHFFKLSEVSYGEVIGDKSAMNSRVTLYWGTYIVTISFGYIFYCVHFNLYSCYLNLFFNVLVCVCVGFVMCGFVYVWVCEVWFFRYMYTLIECFVLLVLLYLYFSFMYIYSYLFCLY